MSNKTSDENVGSIEEDIKIIKNSWLYNDEENVKFVNAIEHLLLDYTRQKQINEEHQKINGELREKVEELEIDLITVYLKGVEDGKDKYEQKIKDKIEELKIQGNYKTFYNPNGRTHFLKEESDFKIEVCEELLQESEDK